MDEEESSIKSDNNMNINNKYPSTFLLLIIILFLFILSFCISILSLKRISKLKINIFFHEYLQLFSSGIYFTFSISNLYILNIYNISSTYLIFFICIGYLLNYFCENILILYYMSSINIQPKYSSSFFRINKNKNENYNDNADSIEYNNDSIITNELNENSFPLDNNLEKRYSTEEKYFSIFNNSESFDKEKDKNKIKEIGFSCDFTKKNNNTKIDNIYMYENLINKNIENKLYENIYIYNLYEIKVLIFNLHKICLGLYIGINYEFLEYKYFIFFCYVIYFFIVIDSFYFGISLSKQIQQNKIYIFIFIHSFIYFLSALIGLLFKYILYEILGNIIKYIIIGIILYKGLHALDNYFYKNNINENKYKENNNNKYYFGLFAIGLILYIIIFLYI